MALPRLGYKSYSQEEKFDEILARLKSLETKIDKILEALENND